MAPESNLGTRRTPRLLVLTIDKMVVVCKNMLLSLSPEPSTAAASLVLGSVLTHTLPPEV